MRRYLRLYLHFVRFSFSKALEFRVDFFFRVAMDIIYYLVNIAIFQVIFLHTNLVAGWNLEQMMIFVACYLLVDAINMTIFSTNMWWLPYYINKGDLDYYLIRPVSPLFFLSLREFSANSFLNLLMAIGIFIFSISSYGHQWKLEDLFVLILLLINGSLIYYLIQMLTIIPAFWTQSTRGFIDLFYTLGLAMERPDRIFKGWTRILFTVILPFSLIASFPARYFIDGLDKSSMFHLVFVSFTLWIVVICCWRTGLKNYSSASS
jgi:ABC-2 type transport system permease protein